MPVKRIVAIVTLGAMATACTASKLQADATVRVTGTVLDASGQPARNADVALFKRADIGEVLIGATLAIGTLGLTCFVANAPSFCEGARKARTDDSGAFSFSLKGSDTQGSVANASDFDLLARVPRPAGGDLASSVRFKIQQEDLEVPALRVWDATPSVTAERGAVRTSWTGLPGGYGDSPDYGVRFVDGQKRVVWNVADAKPGARVDSRLLEDQRGAVEVTASTSTPGPDTTFRYTFFSQGAPYSGAGAPPSRGAACVASSADGQTAPLSPCLLSDGDLFAAANLSSGGGVRTGVYLDLGAPKPIGLVVGRGATGTTAIEASDDARTWTMVGPGSGSLISASPNGSVRARYVRIRTTNNVDIGNLTEISVWN